MKDLRDGKTFCEIKKDKSKTEAGSVKLDLKNYELDDDEEEEEKE